ncbi:MAG: hypothetical protein KGZ51_05860 [Erysipelothrix sp.]|jgi:hypothetical protein|nr:hypothetical protein [Erysipelothrix sp.]
MKEIQLTDHGTMSPMNIDYYWIREYGNFGSFKAVDNRIDEENEPISEF